jgi:hypothetical protein
MAPPGADSVTPMSPSCSHNSVTSYLRPASYRRNKKRASAVAICGSCTATAGRGVASTASNWPTCRSQTALLAHHALWQRCSSAALCAAGRCSITLHKLAVCRPLTNTSSWQPTYCNPQLSSRSYMRATTAQNSRVLVPCCSRCTAANKHPCLVSDIWQPQRSSTALTGVGPLLLQVYCCPWLSAPLRLWPAAARSGLT